MYLKKEHEGIFHLWNSFWLKHNKHLDTAIRFFESEKLNVFLKQYEKSPEITDPAPIWIKTREQQILYIVTAAHI